MKGNYLEAEKLIDCLKAVINQQKIPANDILMNWELFFKTADFHHVSNMVYYTVMGMKQGIPPGVAEPVCGPLQKGCSGGGAVQEPCGSRALELRSERHSCDGSGRRHISRLLSHA